MNRNRIQRMAQTALLGSLALLLSYIETMIPLPFAVPGIKLGLANAAILVALFSIDARGAAAVALIKVLASGFLFGSPTMLVYSAAGTFLAFASMAFSHKVLKLDAVPVSMLSAVFHNVGQLLAAALMLSSTAVFLTLPPLALAACITGAVIGCVAQGVIDALVVESPQRRVVDLSALELVCGESIAFVGANGSGKTTAALQLAGLVGNEGRGARITFQDPDDQIVNQRVQDDVAFGCENMGIELDEMRRMVMDTLFDVGIQDLASCDVNELSGGQKQQVAIAGVLAMRPDLIVFDEATSMQDTAARKRFLDLVERLKERNVAVVMVTQIAFEAACADRVAVFEDCRLAEVVSGSEYAQRTSAGAFPAMPPVKKEPQVGANLREGGVVLANRLQNSRSECRGFSATQLKMRIAPTCDSFSQSDSPRPFEEHSLVLEDVAYCYPGASEPALTGANIIVAPGRIVGLSGPSGSGKSTLAQVAAGYLLPDEGKVLLDGVAMGADCAACAAFRDNVAYVAQAPEKALFAKTAFEDVMFGALNRGLGEEKAQLAAEKALRSVGVDPEVAREKSPFAYSGGEKRRIALAGMLVLDTPYLILDEPNAGLDPCELRRLEGLLSQLACDGKGVLLISHDDAFLDACCDSRVELRACEARQASSKAAASACKSAERNVGFGVYECGDTPMHRLAPQVKLVACVLFMVAGFVASGPVALGLCMLFALGSLTAARTAPRKALRALRPFAFLMVFVGVFDAFFVCSGNVWWQAGAVSLSSGGLVFAAESVARFALVALGTSTLMRTTSATQLADACSLLLSPLSRAGLRVDDAALSLSMTLHFIPLVQREFLDVKRAQEARLASFNAPGIVARVKAYVPVLTPLFSSCLRRSTTLALAIENRAYGSSGRKTRYREYRIGKGDIAVLALSLLLLVASIAL